MGSQVISTQTPSFYWCCRAHWPLVPSTILTDNGHHWIKVSNVEALSCHVNKKLHDSCSLLFLHNLNFFLKDALEWEQGNNKMHINLPSLNFKDIHFKRSSKLLFLLVKTFKVLPWDSLFWKRATVSLGDYESYACCGILQPYSRKELQSWEEVIKKTRLNDFLLLEEKEYIKNGSGAGMSKRLTQTTYLMCIPEETVGWRQYLVTIHIRPSGSMLHISHAKHGALKLILKIQMNETNQLISDIISETIAFGFAICFSAYVFCLTIPPRSSQWHNLSSYIYLSSI